MRDDLTIAVGELYQAIRHEHWQGKTYRQFWTWFNDRCIEIVGMAETADLDALEVVIDCLLARGGVLQLRDQAHAQRAVGAVGDEVAARLGCIEIGREVGAGRTGVSHHDGAGGAQLRHQRAHGRACRTGVQGKHG